MASGHVWLYGECMARLISTTIRLAQEDVRALKRARAAGHSASELYSEELAGRCLAVLLGTASSVDTALRVHRLEAGGRVRAVAGS
jgi:CelD/BcsL family acetyltransferase involved in cellulose biosynthesis